MKQRRPDPATTSTNRPQRWWVTVAVHVGLAVAALGVVRWALQSASGEPGVTGKGWPTPVRSENSIEQVNDFTGDTTASRAKSSDAHAGSDSPDPASPASDSDAYATPGSVLVSILSSNDAKEAIRADADATSESTAASGEPHHVVVEERHPEVVSRVVRLPAPSPRNGTEAETAVFVPAATVKPPRDAAPSLLPPGGERTVLALTRAEVAWAERPAPEPAVNWDTPSGPYGGAVLTTGQLRAAEITFAPGVATEQGGTGATLIANAKSRGTGATALASPTRPITRGPVDGPSYDTGAFFGMPAGRNTVYLIDASGSLIDTLPYAIAELRRALSTLSPEQSYAVVFFRGAEIVEAPPLGMQPATRENLIRTIDWLDPAYRRVAPHGRTDPAAALAHALSYDPDTLFLLSDGLTGLRDPRGDRRALVTMTEQVRRRPRMHTVQFIDPDPLATRGRMGTLELLASLNNGQHRFVGFDDVRPRK